MSDNQDLVQLTADIVAAYVAGNTVSEPPKIPALVAGVRAVSTHESLGDPVEAVPSR